MKKATYIGSKLRKQELGEEDWPIGTKGFYQFDQGDHWFKPKNDGFWGVVNRKDVVIHKVKK